MINWLKSLPGSFQATLGIFVYGVFCMLVGAIFGWVYGSLFTLLGIACGICLAIFHESNKPNRY